VTTMPSSVLALATTIHVSLLLLRQHRSFPGRLSALLLPSLALAAQPWFLGEPGWLVVGLALHVAWFVACEKLVHHSLPPRPPSPARAAVPTSPGGGARRTSGFALLPVLAVVEETHEVRTFRLVRPEGFAFQAGQFVNVRVDVDDAPMARCYSISSAPETPGFLEISVRRQGRVSAALHKAVLAGSALAVKGPAGGFVYPEHEAGPVVLIAGGIGITPLLSMVRHGLASQPRRPVTLLYSARTGSDLAFHDELLSLARRHRHFRLAVTLTRDHDFAGLPNGRIDGAFVTSHVADVTASIFMMCGPHALISELTATLSGLGVPAAQIRFEAFEAAAAAREGAAGATVPAGALRGSRDSGDGYHLTLSLSKRTAVVGKRQTLLEAAEAAGVEIPNSCRAGVCLTCRARLANGEVECASDSLDAADRADGYVLPCVSWAKGDCTLEA